MIMKEWNDIPSFMQNSQTQFYYNILRSKKIQLYAKRLFDIIFSIILIIVLSPIMLIISILIKMDSQGKIIYKQKRITQYGKSFYIFKFRTMVTNAEQVGASITSEHDDRITKIGKYLRKYRLDEFPQLFNILKGDLTFVGTRPEVPKYVKYYTEFMQATLLLPAGVTSLASIEFKDEDKILSESQDDIETTYINKVLPLKMELNLEYIEKFSILNDIKIIILTVLKVVK